jgi:hypothetical protein
MVIHNLDFVGVAVGETKADTPLVIDPDRMPAGAVASQRFKGGSCKSSIRVAASSCLSRIAPRRKISRGNRRLSPVAKNRSVSESANDRIIFV